MRRLLRLLCSIAFYIFLFRVLDAFELPPTVSGGILVGVVVLHLVIRIIRMVRKYGRKTTM